MSKPRSLIPGNPSSQPGNHLTIGQLAAASGYSRHTLRYYEKLDLLSPQSRSAAGYRLYDKEQALQVLEFVSLCKGLGFSLSEIGFLLSSQREGHAICQQVRQLLDSKLRDAEHQLAKLQEHYRFLARVRDVWLGTTACGGDDDVQESICRLVAEVPMAYRRHDEP